MENTWEYLEHSGNRPSGSSNMAMEKSPFSSMIFPAMNLRLVRGFPSHVWLPQGIRQHSTIIYIYTLYKYIHATRKFLHISIISTSFSSWIQIYMTQKVVCHAENPLYHHYITLYAIIIVPLHHIVGMYTMGLWERYIPMISPLYHHYCAISGNSMGYGWHIMVGMTLMRIHGTVKVFYH